MVQNQESSAMLIDEKKLLMGGLRSTGKSGTEVEAVTNVTEAVTNVTEAVTKGKSRK